MRWAPIVALGCASACTSDAPAVEVFDPCHPIAVAAPEEERATLAVAIDTWHELGVTAFTDELDAVELSVVFATAPAGSFGLYDATSATIYVDAALEPGPRAITLAHELGHTIGLVYVAPAERSRCRRRPLGNVRRAMSAGALTPSGESRPR